MSLPRGQVTAIIGDNGAGKSTLVRCIVGVHAPDRGEVLLEGRPVHYHAPRASTVSRYRDRLPGPRAGRGPHPWLRTFSSGRASRRVGSDRSSFLIVVACDEKRPNHGGAS
jgi:ABC-type cobalamin/Fe3+-siderophores transport system ATPase subunit